MEENPAADKVNEKVADEAVDTTEDTGEPVRETTTAAEDKVEAPTTRDPATTKKPVNRSLGLRRRDRKREGVLSGSVILLD